MVSACGNHGTLQSIAIHPSTADAKDYSGGVVPFTATGIYSGGASGMGPVTPIQWCASNQAGVCLSQDLKPGVTISPSGAAECAAGSTGTWIINANSPPYPAGAQPGAMSGASIAVGSATLTCP
jgi:hypothetical protein